jgi:hypothetical protein
VKPDPGRDEARGQAGSGKTGKDNNGNGNNKGGRREVQGIATDRNRCQRAPTYPDPPEAAAFRILEAHWGLRRRS